MDTIGNEPKTDRESTRIDAKERSEGRRIARVNPHGCRRRELFVRYRALKDATPNKAAWRRNIYSLGRSPRYAFKKHD